MAEAPTDRDRPDYGNIVTSFQASYGLGLLEVEHDQGAAGRLGPGDEDRRGAVVDDQVARDPHVREGPQGVYTQRLSLRVQRPRILQELRIVDPPLPVGHEHCDQGGAAPSPPAGGWRRRRYGPGTPAT